MTNWVDVAVFALCIVFTLVMWNGWPRFGKGKE